MPLAGCATSVTCSTVPSIKAPISNVRRMPLGQRRASSHSRLWREKRLASGMGRALAAQRRLPQADCGVVARLRNTPTCTGRLHRSQRRAHRALAIECTRTAVLEGSAIHQLLQTVDRLSKRRLDRSRRSPRPCFCTWVAVAWHGSLQPQALASQAAYRLEIAAQSAMPPCFSPVSEPSASQPSLRPPCLATQPDGAPTVRFKGASVRACQ